MAGRTFRCAIEEVAEWHPRLFLEPHIAAFVAVVGQYSVSPAPFQVERSNVTSRWLGKARRLHLEVGWSEETVDKAERLRATLQSNPMVEFAAVAVTLILTHRAVPMGPLDVTAYGSRADYRSLSRRRVLEISGTESPVEMRRRHRAKVAQALANPFGWDAYVSVCLFCDEGHQILLSGHPGKESAGGEKKT